MNLAHQRKYLQKHNEKNKIFKTDEDKCKVIELYRKGLSCNEIAKIYNCSKTPVLKVLKNEKKRRSGEYSHHFSNVQGFGESHHSWKGGYKSVYERFRDLKAYWEWNRSVKERDNFICLDCKAEENLEVHHIRTLKTLIKEYAENNNILPKDFKESDFNDKFFYDIDNGETLCKECHKTRHKTKE